MSTIWYVSVPNRTRNGEAAIRKMTGWKKFQCPETNTMIQVLTDGEHYVQCDRRLIEIVDHGKYAVLERFGQNYSMEEVLQYIGFSEHDDPTVLNCDNCGRYMMSDEFHTHLDV